MVARRRVRRAGRKPVGTTLDDGEFAALQRAVEKSGMSRATLIAEAILEYIRKRDHSK